MKVRLISYCYSQGLLELKVNSLPFWPVPGSLHIWPLSFQVYLHSSALPGHSIPHSHNIVCHCLSSQLSYIFYSSKRQAYSIHLTLLTFIPPVIPAGKENSNLQPNSSEDLRRNSTSVLPEHRNTTEKPQICLPSSIRENTSTEGSTNTNQIYILSENGLSDTVLKVLDSSKK